MEVRRELLDASAYMMFEAIGDSEAEYFDAEFEQESDAAAEEDDAQSCSYRSSRLYEVVRGGDDFRRLEFDYCIVDEEEDGGGSDEEDGVVDQCRRRSREEAEEAAKSESNLMRMNEIEGDKLFWEACLAS